MDPHMFMKLAVSFLVTAVSSATAFSITTALRETMDIAFQHRDKHQRVLAHWISPLIFTTLSLVLVLTTGYYVDAGIKVVGESE